MRYICFISNYFGPFIPKTIPFLEDLLFGSKKLFCPRGIINKPTVLSTKKGKEIEDIERKREKRPGSTGQVTYVF